jgi:hypothetical protein
MASPLAPLRPRSDTDTRPTWDGIEHDRRARLARRVLLVLFGVVLALGATGWLGVRSGTASARGGGYTLDVTYPRITRAGHAAPLRFTVTKAGGFADGETVTIAVTLNYFSLFDENGIAPEPSSASTTESDLVWEFDTVEAAAMTVSLDTRVGPNRQSGERATVSVLDDAGQPVASVNIRTWVLP